MQPDSADRRVTAALLDRRVAAALLVYAALFVYGSLVPLQWRPLPLADAWSWFIAAQDAKWQHIGRVDMAVNVALPLPLAFGLAHLARRQGPLAWLLVWPLLAASAVAIEFTQTFFPPRDPSWLDVVAQWAGAGAGLALHAACGGRFAGWLAATPSRGAVPGRRRGWLAVWLGVLLLYGLLPLDLSASPPELWRKWLDGRVVLMPFARAPASGLDLLYKRTGDVLLWLPVGLLWRTDGAGRRWAAVLLRGLLAAAALEVLQVFVRSRTSDVTDVLLAGCGVGLGAALPAWTRGIRAAAPSVQRAWLLAAGLAWLCGAAVVVWYPLRFSTAGVTLPALQQVLARIPFQTYFDGHPLNSGAELLHKLLLFLPAGLLAAAWSARAVRPLHPAAGFAAALSLATLLEAGQFFVPGRVPDGTDAALGAIGALLGWQLLAEPAT